MAQNGMSRLAMRGFHKQDVLQYIDSITAEWNEERTQLDQQAKSAILAQEQMQAVADQATAAATEAEQRIQTAEALLAETQQKASSLETALTERNVTIADLTARLEEVLQQTENLAQQVAALTAQRDEAIAAVADAREQIADYEAIQQQLLDRQQQNEQQSEQIDTLQKSVNQYQKVLGEAESAQKRMDAILRPIMEQANRQADETLDDVQAVLAGILAELGEVQGSVEQRRQALHRCKNDSDSRLSAAFGDWLGQTREATPTRDYHFFR